MFDALSSAVMRILVLCYEYPPVGGGGGRIAKNVAEELVTRGHEVRVQTAGMSHLASREIIGGVEICRTQSFRRREDTCAVHEMGLYVATSFLPTLRHIWSWQPDVIHAHFAMPTGLLAWAVHLLTRVPYVLTAHLGDVPGGVPEQTDRLFRWIGPIARAVWRRAAAVTAVSTFVQELAEQAYSRPVARILNGIDLADALPAPPKAVRPERHLVFVGRFNPQKNLLLLIDALEKLSALNWRATFIGDGPDRAAAEQRIARYDLGERVRLTGWLPAAEVHAILRDADILCMPSLAEGLPVAGIEALKHGLAIIASNIPGVRDLVDTGVNGYCVPLNDTAALSFKLQWLLESDETLLSMKRASWERARRFDLKAVAAEYKKVLHKASKQR
jgi:glycosyltransferase involved in cell wall biosynthesis